MNHLQGVGGNSSPTSSAGPGGLVVSESALAAAVGDSEKQNNITRGLWPQNNITDSNRCRGILEQRAAAMRCHAEQFCGKDGFDRIKRISVIGGGSANREFCQIIADVFGTKVIIREKSAEATAIGGIVIAEQRYGGGKNAGSNEPKTTPSVLNALQIEESFEPKTILETPSTTSQNIYAHLVDTYKRLEPILLRQYGRLEY